MGLCGEKWGNVSDSVFQGTSALTLDGKGRMTVPARHRESIAGAPDRTLTFTKSQAGCLFVLQTPAWEDFRRQLMQLPMQADGWRRLFLGSAVAVELDSADRVLVPAELRVWAGLDKDVLLMGMGRRLELWDAQKYSRHEAEVLASPMPEIVQGFVF